MAGHLTQRPDLTMLPVRERTAVARALAKRPGGRWPSCTAFADALAASVAGRPTAGWRRAAVAAGVVGAGLALWLLPSRPIPVGDDDRGSGPSGAATRPHPPTDPQPAGAAGAPAPRPVAARARRLVFDGRTRILTPVERFAPVTLEAWVQPGRWAGGRGERAVIGSDIPGKSGISLGLDYRSRDTDPWLGAQVLPAPTARDVPTTAEVSVGRWSHVAIAFGPDETTVFLNGKVVGRGPATGAEGGTPFVVGSVGSTNPDHYFVGSMLRVRISRGARYRADFTPPETFRPDATAVVVYDAGHVRGRVVTDLSGSGNHGVVDGGELAQEPDLDDEPRHVSP